MSQDGNLDELDKKYRALAAKSHPDRGGSDEKMQRINVAKVIVSAYYQTKTALVPVDTIKEIVLATNKGLAVYEEKKENSKRAFSRVLDINTSKPKKMKRMAASFGGISAGAIFLGKDIPEKYFASFGGGSKMAGMMIFAAITIGIYAAGFWWILDNKVKRIEQDTEDLETSLNDKVYYVDLIHQMFGEKSDGTWEKLEFEESIKEWAVAKEHRHTSLARLIRDAGSAEITSLLIAKGAENDMLKKETKTENKRIRETFSLNI